jgi:hypothetical protein
MTRFTSPASDTVTTDSSDIHIQIGMDQVVASSTTRTPAEPASPIAKTAPKQMSARVVRRSTNGMSMRSPWMIKRDTPIFDAPA